MQRPEVYVVENVPGMKKFPVVMEAMSKLPDYYVSVFCLVQTDDRGTRLVKDKFHSKGLHPDNMD